MDKVNRTVVNAFRNPDKARIKILATEAVHERGETGVGPMKDCRGVDAIVSYAPVDVLGHRWCLLAKMDAKEVMSEVDDMNQASDEAQASLNYWAIGLFFAAGSVVAGIAIAFAGSVTRPVVKAAEFAQQIASGNLTTN